MDHTNQSDSKSSLERRVVSRLDAHERASIRRLGEDEDRSETKEYSCGVLDISRNGLRIFTRQTLSLGEEVEISIERAGFRRTHIMLGVVRWLAPSREISGNFIGLEFLNERDLVAWQKTFH